MRRTYRIGPDGRKYEVFRAPARPRVALHTSGTAQLEREKRAQGLVPIAESKELHAKARAEAEERKRAERRESIADVARWASVSGIPKASERPSIEEPL